MYTKTILLLILVFVQGTCCAFESFGVINYIHDSLYDCNEIKEHQRQCFDFKRIIILATNINNLIIDLNELVNNIDIRINENQHFIKNVTILTQNITTNFNIFVDSVYFEVTTLNDIINHGITQIIVFIIIFMCMGIILFGVLLLYFIINISIKIKLYRHHKINL